MRTRKDKAGRSWHYTAGELTDWALCMTSLEWILHLGCQGEISVVYPLPAMIFRIPSLNIEGDRDKKVGQDVNIMAPRKITSGEACIAGVYARFGLKALASVIHVRAQKALSGANRLLWK